MTNQIALRKAEPGDFTFCRQLYFKCMGWIIEALSLDMARQQESFAGQWEATEVRIITLAGTDVGWLQTASANDTLFLAQLYLDSLVQRQGIGSDVMRMLMREAAHQQMAITLAVVKINPARRLYERLGFRVVREDDLKVYMRHEPDRTHLPAKAQFSNRGD